MLIQLIIETHFVSIHLLFSVTPLLSTPPQTSTWRGSPSPTDPEGKVDIDETCDTFPFLVNFSKFLCNILCSTSDINMAEEPKPNRPRGRKRSAAGLYRYIGGPFLVPGKNSFWFHVELFWVPCRTLCRKCSTQTQNGTNKCSSKGSQIWTVEEPFWVLDCTFFSECTL